jgi:GNAT superfamily N-acetyltransferase
MYVSEAHRREGIAKSLLHYAKTKTNFKSINMSVTHKPDLIAYLEKQGFVLQTISQHEMYLFL